MLIVSPFGSTCLTTENISQDGDYKVAFKYHMKGTEAAGASLTFQVLVRGSAGRVCEIVNGNCDPYVECQNEPTGGVSCGPCPSGFTGSGETGCIDTDECADGNDGGCDTPLQTCENFPGYRTCSSCPAGYDTNTVDGGSTLTCDDIDECAAMPDPCTDPLSVCVNLQGSYKCSPYLVPDTLVPVSGATRDGAALVLDSTTGDEVLQIELSLGTATSYFDAGWDMKLVYGPSDQLDKYEVDDASVEETAGSMGRSILSVTTEANRGGAMLRLSLRVCEGTCTLVTNNGINDLLSYPAPRLIANSIRRYDAPGSGSGSLSSSSAFGELIAFEAEHIVPLETVIPMGPAADREAYTCGIDTTLSTDGLVVCGTPSGLPADSYLFRAIVAEQVAGGTDEYLVANAGEINSVAGGGCETSGDKAIDCPTLGGTSITISGAGFFEPLFVLVGGQPCPHTSLTSNAIVCTLPEGTGRNQAVIVNSNNQFLPTRNLVSYGAPEVTKIFGCTGGATPLDITGCDRRGGQRLTIQGTNFGAKGATVLIGSKPCLDIVHAAKGEAHSTVECVLPPGSLSDRIVLLFQEGGEVATTLASVSYKACQLGEYQEGTECVPCPPGEVSQSTNALSCQACASGTVASEGSSSCSPCKPGTVSATGADECSPCDPGTYCLESGSQQCIQCSPGKFTNDTGSEICEPCGPGWYQPAFGKSTCMECPPGKFAPLPGTSVCTDCPIGTFTADSGRTQCVRCQPGSSQSDSGQSACDLCDIGKHTNEEEQASCVWCEPGRYASIQGKAECDECEPGRAFSGVGATACVACVAGRFASGTRNLDCSACEPGRYAPDGSATHCIDCTGGKAAAVSGATACTECTPGRFTSSVKALTCEQCPQGRFASGNASLSCGECKAGEYQPFAGSPECLTCARGKSSIPSQGTCTVCEQGTVAAIDGSPACALCPSPSTSNEEGTLCVCAVGTYAFTDPDTGTNSCNPCPPGAACNREGVQWESIAAEEGYVRSGDEFLKCLILDHCVGGVGQGDSTCAPHHTGPLCALCEDGYIMELGSTTCSKCPEEGAAWGLSALFFFLLVLALVVLYTLVLRAAGNDKLARVVDHQVQRNSRAESGAQSVDSASTSAGLSLDRSMSYGHTPRATMLRRQHTSNAPIELADWAETADITTRLERRSTVSRIKDAALSSMDAPSRQVILSREMRVPSNLTYNLKIIVGFFQVVTSMAQFVDVPWPTGFLSFARVFDVVNLEFIPWSSVDCAAGLDYFTKLYVVALAPIAVVLLLVLFFLLPLYVANSLDVSDDDTKRKKRTRWLNNFVRLLLFTMFLIYPKVSSRVLGFFACKDVSGTRFLLADFSVTCGSPEWKQHLPAALCFSLLYPVGIPVLFFVILRRNIATLEVAAIRARYGFLYEGYHKDSWFFELVDMGHKLFLTALVIFFPEDLRMPAAMCAAGLYLFIFLFVNPYVRKVDDRLHFLAQSAILLLIICAHVLNEVRGLSATADALLSTVLIVLCIALVVAFLYHVTLHLRRRMRVRQRKALEAVAKELAEDMAEFCDEDDNAAPVCESSPSAGTTHFSTYSSPSPMHQPLPPATAIEGTQ